jgi:5'-methylthioadenosine phosphorylase
MRIAVIGGTGIYDPELFGEGEERRVKTPYGDVELTMVELKGREIVFLPRHGKRHAVPPHKINYRRNMYALKKVGVTRIFATNSVGCINPGFKPGDVVVPHDFVDFTKSRHATFYDDEAVHVDVSEAYCSELREALLEAGKALGEVHSRAVYACTEGPRFETPAEIRMLRLLGCDIVGMTGLPEAALARELEICYASLCTVTNYAAGIAKKKLTATEVLEIVGKKQGKIRKVLAAAALLVPEKRGCKCGEALRGARVK